MSLKNDSFLGTGWNFPPEFTNSGREVVMVSGADDVQQSLEILLGTRLEERILQEEFGCNLDQFVFEGMNSGLTNQLRNMITEAILYHEPRVKLNNVVLNLDNDHSGLLWIELDYTLPSSNTRFNMVYPFYLEEVS